MGKYIDLTGQRFGKLTVINRANKKGELPVKWNCICECGNHTIVDGYSLRSGNTQSCGCLKFENIHKALFNDLTGKRFGRWTVLEYVKSNDNRTYWKCKCDCGTIRNVRADRLTNGTSTSCGCYHNEISTNMFIVNNPNQFTLNKYDLSGEFGIGYTNNNDSEGRNYFYFDLEDYEKIKNYHWHFTVGDYVKGYTKGNNNEVFLHRVIFDFIDNDMYVDHIYHNKFDNRKSQLRICTNAENSFNRKKYITNKTGYPGVTYNKRNNRYYANIGIHGKLITLGSSKDINVAIQLRKEGEEKYFGEYACKEVKNG